MYTVVMMMALSGGTDAVEFGRRGGNGCNGGCHGAVAASYGCSGSACSGTVVHSAPVAVGCNGGCSGYVSDCSGCNGGGRRGLFGGLFGKKNRGCNGGCHGSVVTCSGGYSGGCHGGGVVGCHGGCTGH